MKMRPRTNCRKILRGHLNLCLLNHKQMLEAEKLKGRSPSEVNATFNTYLTTAEEYRIITKDEKKNLIEWRSTWLQTTKPLTKLNAP